MNTFAPVKRCCICHRDYVRREGMMANTCPACATVFDNMRGLRTGECKTPPPDLEARIAEYARRAEAGRPLFGG